MIFTDNTVKFGGAVCSRSYSSISFNGNTTVTYSSNTAGTNGAGIYSDEENDITFTGHSKVTLSSNGAKYGEAVV